MKQFVKDYVDLVKMDCRFLKNHWLGTILVTVLIGVAWVTAYLIWAREYIVWDRLRTRMKNSFGYEESFEEEDEGY